MFGFDLPNEVALFNERNRQALDLLPRFSDTIYRVSKKSVPSNREGLTVFMLCRLCIKDFSEILLLSSNGYGFAALQVLRGMFEKLVDATYLHRQPNEVGAFWDYYLVQLEKLGWEKIAEKYDKDWKQIVATFKTKTKRGKTRTRPRWSQHSLVAIAKDVGMEHLLHECYYLPNLFVHNSPAEILFSLETEADGTISPVDRGGKEEKRFADNAFFLGYTLVLQTLSLVMEHYGWEEDESLVQNCADELEACIRAMHKQEN
jgi:hypothetical protein